MSFKEVRMHLSRGAHAGIAVIRVYPDKAVIAAIERGRLSTLTCDETFGTEAQAFASARALWLSALPPEHPINPLRGHRGYR